MTKHERALKAASLCAGARSRYLPPDDAAAVIAAYLAVMRKPGPDEVRVRAYVCVLPEGRWVIGGASDMPDNDIVKADILLKLGGRAAAQFFWIEANIPAWRPPVEETVEGEVVP